ncbi:hypothetical protein ACIGXM_31835 [Kitasatospora sp. NPDC052896]|uniref:hypothetical protein n=1 Tax=Kitasatospora sp. NPDC052896 TaxID=3364061 RepID=UPI0037CBA980
MDRKGTAIEAGAIVAIHFPEGMHAGTVETVDTERGRMVVTTANGSLCFSRHQATEYVAVLDLEAARRRIEAENALGEFTCW